MLHSDHAVHCTSIYSYRHCNTRLENGIVAFTPPIALSHEQREAGRDDAGSSVVSARHERRGQQPRDDETEDQGGREVREHQLSRVPAGWRRDSPDGRSPF